MKFKIFEFDTKSKLIPSGYYTSTEYTHKLKDVRTDSSFNDTHPSMESALEEINKHARFLKGRTLAIIPFVHVNYDGEITE